MDTLKKLVALIALGFLAFPAVALAHEEPGFEIKGDEFEVEGTVTDVTGNTFLVEGQTVVIDPTMVEEFKAEGTVTVGAMVEAEGVVIDGVNFAEEVEEEAEL